MNILFFTFWYPSEESPYNGIFIKEHASAIKDSGNNIKVLAVNIFKGPKLYDKKIEVLNNNGVETHIIHIKSSLYKWIYSIPFITYLITNKYIKKQISPTFKIELLHSNILFPCAVVGNKIAKNLKVKHIITEHWSGIDKFILKHPFGFLGVKTLKNAFRITAVSAFLKTKIAKYSLNEDNICIIPNIIDNTIFNYSEKKESNKLIFTAVATWKSPKQPHLFIEALNNIQKITSKEINLKIIGNGPLLNHYKENIDSYSLKIEFLGVKNKLEISQLLKESDYFVHASLIETFSIVIAEALFSGVPVIASNTGAIPELINSNYGVISDNSIEAWERSIQKALTMNFNRQKISEENISKFNKSKVAKLFQVLYSVY